MVEIYKVGDVGSRNKLKGKWNQFRKDEFIKYGLEEYFYKPIAELDLDSLYNKLIQIMQKEKFVFFEDVEIKPILKFGKLKEVWVNYWHIN